MYLLAPAEQGGMMGWGVGGGEEEDVSSYEEEMKEDRQESVIERDREFE
jgi:hypothetical protein